MAVGPTDPRRAAALLCTVGSVLTGLHVGPAQVETLRLRILLGREPREHLRPRRPKVLSAAGGRQKHELAARPTPCMPVLVAAPVCRVGVATL